MSNYPATLLYKKLPDKNLIMDNLLYFRNLLFFLRLTTKVRI